ncbi:hypothetical protein ACP3S7_04385 [Phytobacter ursingii]
MTPAEFYDFYGIKPAEMLSGETVNNFASRVFAQQTNNTGNTGVWYSQGTATQSKPNQNTNRQLYTY